MIYNTNTLSTLPLCPSIEGVAQDYHTIVHVATVLQGQQVKTFSLCQ